MQYLISEFNGWIDESDLIEIDKLNNSLTHPIKYLLSDISDSSNCFDCTCFNTFSSVKNLLIKDKNFMALEKKRLFKDKNNDSAILGEIRCYSILKKCFGDNVFFNKPKQRNANPDFTVKKDKELIYIEVNTPQMNGNEAEKLIKHNSIIHSRLSEICYRPYGSGKGTIAQNVISKLTSVKEDNRQFLKQNVNVLWIDLQDQYMDDIDDRLEFESPYFSGKHSSGGEAEGIYSNEIWYALYGKKDMPLFDGHTLDEGARLYGNELNRNNIYL